MYCAIFVAFYAFFLDKVLIASMNELKSCQIPPKKRNGVEIMSLTHSLWAGACTRGLRGPSMSLEPYSSYTFFFCTST